MISRNSHATKIAILDRDGVINQDSDAFIKSVEEWVPIPGSLEAIARLNHAGFRILVVSNQSGLGRRIFDIDALNAMHRKMRRELSVLGAQVEAIFFCPHAPEEDCQCRKPKPGLFEDISQRLQISMNNIPVVCDSYRDIEAAASAGALPLLVLTGKGRKTLSKHKDDLRGVAIFDDLAAATDALLTT